MKSKSVLYFYIISIFLLANGALSNFIFARLHLSIWRQLIFALGLYFMIREIKKIGYSGLSAYVHKIRGFFFVIVAFSLLTIIIDQFNVVRIAFTWWAYFSGLPFIIFPFVAGNCGWSEKKFNYFFIYLGIFQTVGLIIDFFTGGIFTNTFKVMADDTEHLIEMGRYCFLAEAPTTFGVYYAICMMVCMKEFLREQSASKKYVLLIIAVSFLIGAWFTGSRQIVFVLGLVFSLSLVYLLMFSRKGVTSVLLLALTISVAAPTVMSKLYSDAAYEERYSDDSVKEDMRYQWWREGMQYCIFDFDIKRIVIGEAVGYVHGQKALPGERIGRHFENSIWTRMSETGIIGIWLFIFPVLIVLKNFKIRSFIDVLTLSAMIGYLFVSYVSPNGEHQTSQMSLYLAFGLYLYSKFYQNENVRI